MNRQKYRKYEPFECAKLSLNTFTSMIDRNSDYLPYWLIDLDTYPASAQHCRVDDAEICASWAEGLMRVKKMLSTNEGDEVLKGLINITLKGFRGDGLHYNNPYPWADHVFASMHEQAYIASFLTTWYEETKDARAKKYMDNLVHGLRKLVCERETVTFWGGSYPQPRKSYYFIGDAIYEGKGWDFSKHRGSGEEGTRNMPMVAAIMKYYELTGNEEALDLAEGLINYSVIETRYFAYGGKFNGHVHSHLWIAIGLARFARVTGSDMHRQLARDIFEYGKKISSSFGFVPEFAGFKHPGHITSESCCIKDMIELAFEMIKLGYDEWDTIDRYARNQLVENQIRSTPAIIVDNTLDDTQTHTYKDLDKRIIGGFTGHASPNHIPIDNRRALAGCCTGIAPQAHYMVWENTVIKQDDCIDINFLFDIDTKYVMIECAYPNVGYIKLTAKEANSYRVRIPKWVGERITLKINGEQTYIFWDKDYIVFNLGKNDIAEISHQLQEVVTNETVNSIEYTIVWRGNHIVRLLPEGKPYRLYDRTPGGKRQEEGTTDKKSRVIKATDQQI
ncbi:MAG: hypothetical protein M0R40_06930 [Firmicutes bacterium]|nr:hypothetical protein [Bacillota bacterium]